MPPRPLPVRRARLTTGLLLIAALQSASAQVTGEASERRPLPAFDRLRVEGALKATFTPGPTQAVQVVGAAQRLALVQSHVESGTLVLRVAPGLHWRQLPQVIVTAPMLRAAEVQGSGDLRLHALRQAELQLAVSGSGDLVATELDTGQLRVAVAGSGDVRLQGQCSDAQITVAGSGDVHADSLRCRQVDVSVAGSGDARVQASSRLTASVAGTGDVHYRGQPERLVVRSAGLGQVHALP